MGDASDKEVIGFKLCGRCFRAVPAASSEHFCPNDGTRLLERCPGCGVRINSPYARFCVGCGSGFALAKSIPDYLALGECL